MADRYPVETLDPENEDDGTMPENVAALTDGAQPATMKRTRQAHARHVEAARGVDPKVVGDAESYDDLVRGSGESRATGGR